MGYVTLKTTCDEGANAKTIDVSYLIMDTTSPYNIILRRPTFNTLESVVSTQYLMLNYSLQNLRVGTIRGDQQVDRECYLRKLETAKEKLTLVDAHPYEFPSTNFKGWDPIYGVEAE